MAAWRLDAGAIAICMRCSEVQGLLATHAYHIIDILMLIARVDEYIRTLPGQGQSSCCVLLDVLTRYALTHVILTSYECLVFRAPS